MHFTGPKNVNVTIIGCGLAGCFLAVLLANRGIQVNIYEKFSKEDIYDSASKRSYNIVLFGFGITLLKKAGLWESIKPHLLSLTGTVTHIANQQKPVISYVDQKKLPYFTISRAKLAQLLVQIATEQSLVKIHFNNTLLSVNRHNKTIIIKNNQTGQITSHNFSVLIGADGANSLVRNFIQQGQHTEHSQEFAQWVYKQFTLSKETVLKLHLEKKIVHIWTQKKAFITMHPDSNDALGAMLVMQKNDKSSQFNSKVELKRFFESNFPELVPAFNEIALSILENNDGTFATIHTSPWYYKDFMTIVGDAAHGFYPFFGQGTTAAFSDCMTIIELLDENNYNWELILPMYQKYRKENADALGELSKDVLSKYLRFKKADFNAIFDRMENIAHHIFPNFIHKPLSLLIINDPENAAFYRKSDQRQKKYAKRFGIILFITIFTALSTIIEKNSKLNYTK